jgi:O-methyltransferase involved in polyketide biosynthesis
MPASDARISPTAHYTSTVWFRNGMSHPALTSRLGRVLYRTLQPMNYLHLRLSRAANLEMTLLARHRIIDHLLAEAIESGKVRQVIEIAAGLSPRGYRFARRYAGTGLRYLEGDLPEMAAHKRAALADAGLLGANHDVVHLDALTADGPASLAAVVAERLDATKGTAIITEGLTGYLDRASLEGMWRRFARVLAGFRHGVHYADLFLGGDTRMLSAAAFAVLLGAFVRGKLHLHYRDPGDAEVALHDAGFGEVKLHVPAEFRTELDLPGVERVQLVHVLEATASRAA